MAAALTFQRIGASSNTHVGSDFESIAKSIVSSWGIATTANFPVEVGHEQRLKSHRFDLGSESPPLLVECKCHTWTAGGNSPSAKLTVWNEAMYYFALSPSKFRKVFFVLKDVRNAESLAEYYVRRYGHLIPDDVEVWEYCTEISAAVRIFPAN